MVAGNNQLTQFLFFIEKKLVNVSLEEEKEQREKEAPECCDCMHMCVRLIDSKFACFSSPSQLFFFFDIRCKERVRE